MVIMCPSPANKVHEGPVSGEKGGSKGKPLNKACAREAGVKLHLECFGEFHGGDADTMGLKDPA